MPSSVPIKVVFVSRNRYISIARISAVTLAAFGAIAFAASFSELPFYTCVANGSNEHVEFSLNQGTFYVVWDEWIGIGRMPEHGWRFYAFVNDWPSRRAQIRALEENVEWPNSYLAIPCWITLIPSAILILRFVVRKLKRKLDHCKCGYNLTGNVSGHCPECGRTVSVVRPVAIQEAG